jgi:hypothetical protein
LDKYNVIGNFLKRGKKIKAYDMGIFGNFPFELSTHEISKWGLDHITFLISISSIGI